MAKQTFLTLATRIVGAATLALLPAGAVAQDAAPAPVPPVTADAAGQPPAPAYAAPSVAPSLPVEFRAAPNTSSYLGRPVLVGPYAIRLPPYFTLVRAIKVPDGPIIDFFAGQKRPDHEVPAMLVTVYPPLTAAQASSAVPENVTRAVDMHTHSSQAFDRDTVLTVIQAGRSQGLDALRWYAHGVIARGGPPRIAHTMEYVFSTPGAPDAYVLGIDTDPDAQYTLPVIEASCLSLRLAYLPAAPSPPPAAGQP